jgi:hypothetical protein
MSWSWRRLHCSLGDLAPILSSSTDQLSSLAASSCFCLSFQSPNILAQRRATTFIPAHFGSTNHYEFFKWSTSQQKLKYLSLCIFYQPPNIWPLIQNYYPVYIVAQYVQSQIREPRGKVSCTSNTSVLSCSLS